MQCLRRDWHKQSGSVLVEASLCSSSRIYSWCEADRLSIALAGKPQDGKNRNKKHRSSGHRLCYLLVGYEDYDDVSALLIHTTRSSQTHRARRNRSSAATLLRFDLGNTSAGQPQRLDQAASCSRDACANVDRARWPVSARRVRRASTQRMGYGHAPRRSFGVPIVKTVRCPRLAGDFCDGVSRELAVTNERSA
jgi:hypothetical protein